jgi:hypothetical protein
MWSLLEGLIGLLEMIGILADDKQPVWVKILIILILGGLGLAVCYIVGQPR